MTQAQKNLTIPIVAISLMMAWALYPGNPYGYYVLLRLICSPLLLALFFFSIAMIKFSRPAEYPADLFGWPGFFIVFALLYNPLVQVHLTREIWSVLNIVTIILLGGFWQMRVRTFQGTLVFSETPKPPVTPGKTLSDYDSALELLNQAKSLFEGDKFGESTKLLDQLIEKYGKIKKLDVERIVGRAIFCKALNLSKLSRKEEAAKVYLAFIDKYKGLKMEPFIELVQLAREAISRNLPSN